MRLGIDLEVDPVVEIGAGGGRVIAGIANAGVTGRRRRICVAARREDVGRRHRQRDAAAEVVRRGGRRERCGGEEGRNGRSDPPRAK